MAQYGSGHTGAGISERAARAADWRGRWETAGLKAGPRWETGAGSVTLSPRHRAHSPDCHTTGQASARSVFESSHLESAHVGATVFFFLKRSIVFKENFKFGRRLFLFTRALTTSVFFPLCRVKLPSDITFLQPEKLPLTFLFG